MFIKNIIYLFLIVFPLSLVAQIGINTENIQENILFHIDPMQNNAKVGTVTSVQMVDDFVVTEIGDVGIGTINPTSKLHLSTGGTKTSPKPQLRIEDGLQVAGKIFTSDANGKGHWAIYAAGAELGNFTTIGINISGSQSTFLNTGCKIALAPGKWVVIYTLVLNCNYSGTPAAGYKLWVKSTIGDSATATISSNDIFGNTLFCNTVMVQRKGTITGRCLVENKSLANKDYYILVGNIVNNTSLAGVSFSNVGKKGDSGSFYAFRIGEQK